MKKIISIFGPTGIGKSIIAIELAKKNNGEIIGVDSRQIYKGVSIGTAQPNQNQLNEVPHHLIGFKDLNEKISAGEYLQLIDKKIDQILSENKSPILCGGTGLYFKSLVEGIFLGSHTNEVIRKRLEQEYENDKDKLFKKLIEIDPTYSEKVHINNKKRLVRALEVFETTGKPMSENFDLISKASKYTDDYCFVYVTINPIILRNTHSLRFGIPNIWVIIGLAFYNNCYPAVTINHIIDHDTDSFIFDVRKYIIFDISLTFDIYCDVVMTINLIIHHNTFWLTCV